MWKHRNERNYKRDVSPHSLLDEVLDTGDYAVVKEGIDDEFDANLRRLFHDLKFPKHLLDPMHHNFMEDPVALSSGYIFDRASVLDNEGNLKYGYCPVSGKKLDDTVIPLPSIKRETLQYLEQREWILQEIANELFAKYHTFNLILGVVEKYLEGQEDMFLPLVRELASRWIHLSPKDQSTQSGGKSRTFSHRPSTRKHNFSSSYNTSTYMNDAMDEMSYRTHWNDRVAPLPIDMIPALRGKYKFIDDTNTYSTRHHVKDERSISHNVIRNSSFESALNSLDNSSKPTGSEMTLKDRKRSQNYRSTRDEDEIVKITTRPSAILDGEKQLEKRDVDNNSTRNQDDHKRLEDMKLQPTLLMVDHMKQSIVGGHSVVLVKSGHFYGSVNRIMISADEIFQDSSPSGRSKVVLVLYNNRAQPVSRADVFDNAKVQRSRFFYEIAATDDNGGGGGGHDDEIISKVRPGYFYQLECDVAKGSTETISLRGLICKIIPSNNQSGSVVRMKDPEGESGRYMGPLDSVGNPHGKGIFEYENGCTFVGDFVRGKFYRGVYYKGKQIHGTMKNGKWDDRDIDRMLANEYVYDARVFSRELKQKSSKLSDGIVEQNGDESNQYSFLCCGGQC